MTTTTEGVAALFVDFENVYFALTNEHGLGREDALTCAMEVVAELRRQLRSDGWVLVVERCFADWEQIPATAQRQLQVSGLLPRYTESRVAKSTADIELSLDILHYITTRPELQRIILVGGDRDYLPILRRVKESHRAIMVCSVRACLSGDVREFAANYSKAEVMELDSFIEPPKSSPAATSAATAKPTAPARRAPKKAPSPALELEPTEWHTRYLQSLMRFLKERMYSEAHLGPFFRWLETERLFELVSHRDQRRIFEELKKAQAIQVVEHDTGHGYSFSAATLNWNHPLVRELNEVEAA